jgi:hypothetical protein
MNENLYERKLKFIEHLSREHDEKPRYWWGLTEPEFQRTSNTALRSKIRTSDLPEIIIKNNFRNAIIAIAFFIAILIFRIVKNQEIDPVSDFFALMLFVLLLFQVADRGPKIIISKRGIWIKKVEGYFPWKEVIETYIHRDDSADATSHYLRIYYFDDELNEFRFIEQSLDGLDLRREDISFWIEKFKSQS